MAILQQAETALKLILGLTYTPRVAADFVQSEAKGQSTEWIRPGMEEGFFASLQETQAEASVHSREGVDYFFVMPDRWFSAPLGAAIAIAIAIAEHLCQKFVIQDQFSRL